MKWVTKEMVVAFSVWLLVLFALAASLGGCTPNTLTVQPPANTLTAQETMLANAYVTLTAQRQTARQMADRGKLTTAQYATIVARFDTVRKELDLAAGIVNTPNGQTAIATALNVLLTIEAEYGFKEAGR